MKCTLHNHRYIVDRKNSRTRAQPQEKIKEIMSLRDIFRVKFSLGLDCGLLSQSRMSTCFIEFIMQIVVLKVKWNINALQLCAVTQALLKKIKNKKNNHKKHTFN